MASLVVSGAKVVLYVNSRPFAQVSSFQWSSDTPSKEIRGIDSVQAIELAPTTAGANGQIGLYRLTGDGGLEGNGISAPYVDLPAQRYVRIQLIERTADMVLFEANFCRVEFQGWQVASKTLMTGTTRFRSLDCSNEATSFNK